HTYNTMSTKQRNCTSHTQTRNPHKPGAPGSRVLDARNHYPQIKHHTPPPKTGRQHRRVASKPNSVSGDPATPKKHPFHRDEHVCCAPSRRHYSNRLHTAHTPTNRGCFSWCSLERR